MKLKQCVTGLAVILGMLCAQTPQASAMDEHVKQICAAIGLIYHLQAKEYDDKIKQGKDLIKQSTDKKMNKLIASTFHDMAAVRDNVNKLGDFMEREFGKAESAEQMNFAQQNKAIPLDTLKGHADECLKDKAFG